MAEYIERESVVDYIRYKVCQAEGNIEHRCQRGTCAYCGISEIMSDISCMPAADVQPVKRAKWEYYKNNGIMDTYRCSVCDVPYQFPMDTEPSSIFSYCPFCGADMREHEPIKG